MIKMDKAKECIDNMKKVTVIFVLVFGSTGVAGLIWHNDILAIAGFGFVLVSIVGMLDNYFKYKRLVKESDKDGHSRSTRNS